jgi:leader peptidase (prepilin peptidase) / N-methyltransferase
VLIAAILLGLLGLALGSFAGVLAFRLPRGESPLGGRSRCDSCDAPVAARDNVPVVSWVLLRGRCRSCGAAIPIRYPLIELGLGLGFAATYLLLEDQGAAEVVLGCVFLFVLAIITLTDLERRIIPNAVLGPAAVAAVAITLVGDPDLLVQRLLAAAIAGGVLLLISLLYPRGMGMGDVKLAAVMGLYLGRAVAPALLFGFLVGALYGLALIASRGTEARKTAVPFGPFLALGGVVGLLAGDEIVDWYVDNFFSG